MVNDLFEPVPPLILCRRHVLSSFFLHISKEEQLERFKKRLDDPACNWKISESDYKDRELRSRYVKADEDVFAKTTKHAPWYVIPSNHKCFRKLAVSRIVVATMKDLGMRLPKPTVDLEAIRKEYHEAAEESGGNDDERQPDLDGIAVALEGSVGVTRWNAKPAASVGVTQSTAGLVAIPFPCHAR